MYKSSRDPAAPIFIARDLIPFMPSKKQCAFCSFKYNNNSLIEVFNFFEPNFDFVFNRHCSALFIDAFRIRIFKKIQQHCLRKYQRQNSGQPTILRIQFSDFLIMEEVCPNKTEKFCKVQQKLEMLAQSKLQNLNTSTLRKVEDRILTLEKGVCEEIASNQKLVREYRLLMRKYQQQWHEMSERCHQTSVDRSAKITELKELMADYFTREDSDSKGIYKQVPVAFEEKTERIGKELAEQIIERRQETRELEMRVEEALLMFRESMHGQLDALDREVDARFEELRANCELLRNDIATNTDIRRKGEAAIMEQLRDTVGEIKQLISSQRVQREKNRDKLCALLNNAKEMIVKA